jgi:glycosyltransferase involved in cell wall biosynthesis
MRTNGPPHPVRVLRVIARMNIGGPAYHVSLLSGRMDPERYSTLLVHGRVGRGEASFEGLAVDEGARVELVPSLGPELRPASDLRALIELVRIVRRFRPHIVHTHTAKAGALGRLAAWLGSRPRPLVVHTYHGHVLEGHHFGRLATGVYRTAERRLARISDRLVGVSERTVEELVDLKVAPREAFRVVPLGLDLERFLNASPADGAEFRDRVGAGPDDVLLTCVCRLVPHKRVDLLLHALARLRGHHPSVLLAVVGDGTHRPALELLTDELRIRDAVTFVGFLTDVVPVAAAADIAVLSSESDEGTPVSLIEAAAAGVPAVATTVGGVGDVVTPDSGVLVPRGDVEALATEVAKLARDPDLRRRMGERARAQVRHRFAVGRLLSEVEALYEDLLSRDGRRGLAPRPLPPAPTAATAPPSTPRGR